jgi:hypothetical protein
MSYNPWQPFTVFAQLGIPVSVKELFALFQAEGNEREENQPVEGVGIAGRVTAKIIQRRLGQEKLSKYRGDRTRA